jgi:hypothetical protein
MSRGLSIDGARSRSRRRSAHRAVGTRFATNLSPMRRQHRAMRIAGLDALPCGMMKAASESPERDRDETNQRGP